MDHYHERQALNAWIDREQRLEAAHLLDQLELCREKSFRQVTPFLAPAMREWLEQTARRFGMEYRAEGGFQEGERARLIIARNEEGIAPCSDVILIQVIPESSQAKLDHRHILGSLIGLGLERQVIGDIRAGQASTYYVATTPQIGAFLEANWVAVGREKVNVALYHGQPELEPEQGEMRRITVASSRLDALLAEGFDLSRAVAQELIRQGKVKIKDRIVSKQDMELAEGDWVSCRGYGRMRLLESGVTRKGRIAWKIAIFRSSR